MKDQSIAIAITKSRALLSDVRLTAIDIERGLIMCLMALSHCLEYVSVGKRSNLYWNDPLWEGSTVFELLRHALISTVASGGFFFMMGIGLVFLWRSRVKEGWSPVKILRYLVQRGLLLIALQFTILQLFECIAERRIYVYVGVLCSLGICMIAASLMLFAIQKLLEKQIFEQIKIYYLLPLIFVVAIPWYCHLVITPLVANGLTPSVWQTIFLLGGHYDLGGIDVSINFTPFPWFTAVAFGLVIGHFIARNQEQAFRTISSLAAVFLSFWLVLRVGNNMGFFSVGDYKSAFVGAPFHWSSLLSLSKYPPSISYYLWSLGLNMAGIVAFKKAEETLPYLMKMLEPLQIFGRSALFFFVTHWFVYFGLSLVIPYKLQNTWSVLAVWTLGLIMLYTLCRFYYSFKVKKAKDSIWRMF